jgi:peptidoglycan/xylan/chitin deacetylase (PgdA/CDA1 family)
MLRHLRTRATRAVADDPQPPAGRHPARLAVAVLIVAMLAALVTGAVLAAWHPGLRAPLTASHPRRQATPAATGSQGEATGQATAEPSVPAPPSLPGIPGGPGPTPAEGLPGAAQGGASPPAASGRSVNVRILLYHYVRGISRGRDPAGYRLAVSPAVFSRQMALLRSDGVHTISLGEVMAALDAGTPLPPRPIVLTFDDGYNDFAEHAVPILEQNGFTATTFVVPGFLGRHGYMTEAQVEEVAAAGMTVGAHTMHHVDLAVVAPGVARDEITRSREVLQQLSGQPVLDFAYPYGIFTRSVETMVEEAGFRDAASTEPGSWQFASQPYILRRIEVGGGDSLASFAAEAGVPPPVPGWSPPATSPAPSPTFATPPPPSPGSPAFTAGWDAAPAGADLAEDRPPRSPGERTYQGEASPNISGIR